MIEASLKLLPATEGECRYAEGNVLIWAHDHTNLIIIAFYPDEICIAYPDIVRLQMDTTDSFHIYRIEAQGRRVQVYVDGRLR